MRKTIAGIFIVLSVTACGVQETKEVTPQSCIEALDINSRLFTYLGNGDIEGYIEYGKDKVDHLGDLVADCRSKAVDSGRAS